MIFEIQQMLLLKDTVSQCSLNTIRGMCHTLHEASSTHHYSLCSLRNVGNDTCFAFFYLFIFSPVKGICDLKITVCEPNNKIITLSAEKHC